VNQFLIDLNLFFQYKSVYSKIYFNALVTVFWKVLDDGLLELENKGNESFGNRGNPTPIKGMLL
jgi:hypothetical protein